MSAISELASASRRSGLVGGRRSAMVCDLRAGMTIALPFREFRLPWLVLAEPVPVSSEASMVMIQRVRQGCTSGVPVGVTFLQTARVDRLPRHYGVCSSCGGLSPCVDEWVESSLDDLESAAPVRPAAVASPEDVSE